MARLTVIYDDTCPICRRGAERLGRKCVRGSLELVGRSKASDHPAARRLASEAVSQSLHVINESGEVYVGADAVRVIARALPGYQWAGWILGLPLIRSLANPVYRWVARHRHLFG